MSDQVIEEDWHIINETIITESAVVSKNGKRLRQRVTIQLRTWSDGDQFIYINDCAYHISEIDLDLNNKTLKSTAFNINANW